MDTFMRFRICPVTDAEYDAYMRLHTPSYNAAIRTIVNTLRTNIARVLDSVNTYEQVASGSSELRMLAKRFLDDVYRSLGWKDPLEGSYEQRLWYSQYFYTCISGNTTTPLPSCYYEGGGVKHEAVMQISRIFLYEVYALRDAFQASRE